MVKSSVMRFIEGNYALMGMDMDNSYDKVKVILETYKETVWGDIGKLDISNLEDTIDYESFYGDDRFSFLLKFVSQDDLLEFRRRARSAMQTKEMSALIRQALMKVREYPRQGEMYYRILDLRYMNFFSYCESDILEQINVDRSTYYRKKKEAMYLLGYTLFGLIIPAFIVKAQSA